MAKVGWSAGIDYARFTCVLFSANWNLLFMMSSMNSSRRLQ